MVHDEHQRGGAGAAGEPTGLARVRLDDGREVLVGALVRRGARGVDRVVVPLVYDGRTLAERGCAGMSGAELVRVREAALAAAARLGE